MTLENSRLFFDHGLLYDNDLELPVNVRAHVPVLMVGQQIDYLSAALHADPLQLETNSIAPAKLDLQALPQHGLVALRARTSDGARVAAWITRDGGVLWSELSLLPGFHRAD